MEYLPPLSSSHEWYDPEQVQAMGKAFDHACATLDLADVLEGRTAVALQVIAAAKAGDRDADRLYETIMRWACAA